MEDKEATSLDNFFKKRDRQKNVKNVAKPKANEGVTTNNANTKTSSNNNESMEWLAGNSESYPKKLRTEKQLENLSANKEKEAPVCTATLDSANDDSKIVLKWAKETPKNYSSSKNNANFPTLQSANASLQPQQSAPVEQPKKVTENYSNISTIQNPFSSLINESNTEEEHKKNDNANTQIVNNNENDNKDNENGDLGNRQEENTEKKKEGKKAKKLTKEEEEVKNLMASLGLSNSKSTEKKPQANQQKKKNPKKKKKK